MADEAVIPEEAVEATWQETALLSPREADRKLKTLFKLQPALLAFVAAESEDLSPSAAALVHYLFFTVARMFYRGGTKPRKINVASIERIARDVETRVASLQGAHDKFLEQAARALAAEQPYVFRYVIEAIVEAPDSEEDPIDLTAEDQGAIFLTLATVISALHEARTASA